MPTPMKAATVPLEYAQRREPETPPMFIAERAVRVKASAQLTMTRYTAKRTESNPMM